MEEKLCVNCKYFMQHYIKLGLKFRTLHGFGHCKHKRTTGDLKVCKHYLQKDADKEKQTDYVLAAEFLKDILKRINQLSAYFENT